MFVLLVYRQLIHYLYNLRFLDGYGYLQLPIFFTWTIPPPPPPPPLTKKPN